eukprot:m.57206 g.57206  ORF g.57206 m.57206 type:complete len:51 (-) comp22346_c0_seq3:166-318(-)
MEISQTIGWFQKKSVQQTEVRKYGVRVVDVRGVGVDVVMAWTMVMVEDWG